MKVSQALSGLETSTVYHYRLAASSSAGTSYGEDKTLTTGYPAKWLVNGKEAFLNKNKAEGTIVPEDSGMGVVAECTVVEEGELFGKEGDITEVVNTKGESKFTCHTVRSGFCGEAAIEVQASGLPWSTGLVEAPITNAKGEVVRYEPRERFYNKSSSAGWHLSCKFFASTAEALCTGEPSGNLENITTGVPLEFDSKSAALTSGAVPVVRATQRVGAHRGYT